MDAVAEDVIPVPPEVRAEVEAADILVMEHRNPAFAVTRPLRIAYGRAGRREAWEMSAGDPVTLRRTDSGAIIIGDGAICLEVGAAKDRKNLLRSVVPMSNVLVEDETGFHFAPVGGGTPPYTDEDILYRMETVPASDVREVVLPAVEINVVAVPPT